MRIKRPPIPLYDARFEGTTIESGLQNYNGHWVHSFTQRLAARYTERSWMNSEDDISSISGSLMVLIVLLIVIHSFSGLCYWSNVENKV